MSFFGQPCPLDVSELVCLGGWYARPSKPDTSYAYYPRCDAAFVCWEDPISKEQDIFTWKRRGSELLLVDEDRPRMAEYRTYDWNAVEVKMLHGVRSFLQHRFSKVQGCPNDGGRIPLIADMPFQGESTVRFYWCVYCAELFAYLMDKDYGWRCVARFAYKGESAGYVLWGAHRNDAPLEAIRKCAASLPMPGTAMQIK